MLKILVKLLLLLSNERMIDIHISIKPIPQKKSEKICQTLTNSK